MKKVLTGMVLVAFALAGCVSVRENRLEDGSLAVEIQDDGWYFFGFLPLASGNPDGWWPHWFTDDVNPEKTVMILDRILAREGATAIGPLVTREEDENILIVITRVSYHTSAVIPAKDGSNTEKE